MRLLQIGFGLEHLLVELGRFDLGHRLAGCDAVADVHQAAFDVAVGARQNGSFGHGFNVAGQLQFADFRRSGPLRSLQLAAAPVPVPAPALPMTALRFCSGM